MVEQIVFGRNTVEHFGDLLALGGVFIFVGYNGHKKQGKNTVASGLPMVLPLGRARVWLLIDLPNST
ncbi:hypothetical protein GCM10027578_42910 [Spirosoma luteolum]